MLGKKDECLAPDVNILDQGSAVQSVLPLRTAHFAPWNDSEQCVFSFFNVFLQNKKLLLI